MFPAHMVRHPKRIGDEILSPGGGGLDQTVQQIAARFVVVIGQVGVHLERGRQVRDVRGVFLVCNDELFAGKRGKICYGFTFDL